MVSYSSTTINQSLRKCQLTRCWASSPKRRISFILYFPSLPLYIMGIQVIVSSSSIEINELLTNYQLTSCWAPSLNIRVAFINGHKIQSYALKQKHGMLFLMGWNMTWMNPRERLLFILACDNVSNKLT